MKRSSLPWISLQLVVGSLPCLLVNLTLHASAAEGLSEREIVRLIEDLSSESFETREAATKALMDVEDEPAAVRKAMKSSDLEVRTRVDRILKVFVQKRCLRGLARAKALSKNGHIIEASDRVAYWGEWDSKGDGWDNLTRFSDRVIRNAAGYFPPQSFRHDAGFPAGDFRCFVNVVHPREISQRKIDIDIGAEPPQNQKQKVSRNLFLQARGRLLLRGEKVSYTGHIIPMGLWNGIIASVGDVQLMSAHNSIIFAGGDMKYPVALRYCIVVCDGDVELLRQPDAGSLIIARGKVTCSSGKLTRCLVRSGQILLLPDGKTIDFKDGTPDPLAFVKFFELADVGIAAEDLPAREKSGAEGVRLKEVRKESPFAAGLRAGDVITAIEDKKTPTTEPFRRVLRRKLAEGGPTLTFTVSRSGKMLDVPLHVKD